MGIKLKNRDPKFTDFASNDIVINHKEGTLFIKSDTEVKKLSESGGGGGSGNIDVSGTPANNQLTIWEDADTIKGGSDLTFDGTDLYVDGNIKATNVRLPGAGVISFDDSLDGTDQFIKGDDHNITIEGDDYINLKADEFVRFRDGSNNNKLFIDANNGHITASGNISASGNLSVNNLTTDGGTISIGGSNSNVELNAGSDIILEADNSGGGMLSSIQYLDSGGTPTNRIILAADSGKAVLCNRASNGVVQIRANTSTAGSGGEVEVAEFQDDKVVFNTEISSSGNVYSTNVESLWNGSFFLEDNNYINALHHGNASLHFWYGPNKQGINYHYWNHNYGNDSAIGTLTPANASSTGIKVPFKCVLLGFNAVVSNSLSGTQNGNGDDVQTVVALYTADGAAATFNDTDSAAADLTITQRATATTTDQTTANANSNPMTLSVTNGTTELAAGDMIYPRIKVLNATLDSSLNESCNGILSILVQRIK